jgi:hypothetical protein
MVNSILCLPLQGSPENPCNPAGEKLDHEPRVGKFAGLGLCTPGTLGVANYNREREYGPWRLLPEKL